MSSMSPVALVALLSSVSSIQDVQSLIVEVKQYAKWLSHNAVKQRLHLELQTASEQPFLTPTAQEVIASIADSTDGAAIDDLIAELEDLRDSAPQLTITLAAPAGGELKRALVAWCRQNVDPNVLVSFQFNSTILGGMVVRYGSRIFDWSFRRQVLSNRDKFPAALRALR